VKTVIGALLGLGFMSEMVFAQGHTIIISAPNNCPNDPASGNQQNQSNAKQTGGYNFATDTRWNCIDPQMLKGFIADIDDRIMDQTHNPLAETVWGIVDAKEVSRAPDRLTCHGVWYFDQALAPHNRRQVPVTWYWVNGPYGHADFSWNPD